MAKTLGTLTVLIGASTALFQRDLDRASKFVRIWGKQTEKEVNRTIAKLDDDLAKFSSSIDRAFSDPKGVIGDFIGDLKVIGPLVKTAAVGVGAFAASFGLVTAAGIGASQMFLQLSENIQFTSDVAERLGVSFEFLRGLESAAASFGINAAQLNDNLRQMTTFLTSAKLSLDAGAASAGVFGQAIATIGLDVQTLFDLDPEDRLLAIVEGMSQIEDETTRAGVAVRVFGESGRDLVSLAEDGAAGLERTIEQFNRLGAALSDQELQKIEDARTALFEVGLVVEGLTQQFLASFAPIFTTLAQFLAEAGITGSGVKDTMDAMALGVAQAIGVVDSVVAAGFAIWFRFTGAVQVAAGGVLKVMAGLQRGVGAAIAGISNLLIDVANFIGAQIANIMNGAIAAINQGISAINAAVPGVNFGTIGQVSAPRITGRVSAPGFNAAEDEALAQQFIFQGQARIAAADTFQSDFVDRFIANRDTLPQSRFPRAGGTGAAAGGSGGSGGGGRGGRAGGADTVEKDLKKKEAATKELEKALMAARKRLEELNQTFTDDLRTTLESNEAEEFRLQLLEQGAMRVDEQVRRFEELRSARDAFIASEQELEGLLMQGLITQQQYSDSIAQITSDYETLEQTFAQSDLISQEQDRVRAVTELADQLNEALRDQLGINEQLTEVERLRLEIRQLDVELTEKQIVSLEKLAATVDLTAARTSELESQYALLGEASDIFLEAGQNLFSELIRGTGSLADRVGNFFNSLFDNLLQLSLNTIFQSLLGGGGGGGGFLGGIFGGLFGSFQSGGMVPETGPYLLHSGERVLNIREVNQMGRREGGKVIINNYTGSQVSTRMNSNGDREIIIREAVQQARTAVENDFTRSVSSGYGRYADGIQGSYSIKRKI